MAGLFDQEAPDDDRPESSRAEPAAPVRRQQRRAPADDGWDDAGAGGDDWAGDNSAGDNWDGDNWDGDDGAWRPARGGLAAMLRGRKTLAIIGAVVLVVVLGLLGRMLINRGSSEPALDTSVAASHLAEVLDGLEADGASALEECPLPRVGEIFLGAPEALRPHGWQPADVASGFSGGSRRLITCVADGNRLRVDSVKLAITVGEPRTDSADLASEAAPLELRLSSPVRYESGQIVAGCAFVEDRVTVGEARYCLASFTSADLSIDLVASVPVLDEDADGTQLTGDWLRATFPAILTAITETPVPSPSITSPSVATPGVTTSTVTSPSVTGPSVNGSDATADVTSPAGVTVPVTNGSMDP